MSELVLRPLRLEDETLFQAAVRAFDDPEFPFALHQGPGMSFAGYLERLAALREGRDLSPGIVPDTVLFGFAEGALVGRISIRHCLNASLARINGHIGYGVVPGFRRKGYAREMLRLALPIAKAVGIRRALLTCDETNVGSRKTIEACGGVFEGHVEEPPGSGHLKQRYWIALDGP